MVSSRLFRDREDAGRQLASQLLEYRDASPLVLGLSRGGVPVAYEVARALDAQLDVWVVRKLGAPVQPALRMGAVAERGEVLLDEAVVALACASKAEVDALVAQKTAEVEAICRRYRGKGEGPQPHGRTVILVDDGIATGGSARAALRALWRQEPRTVVLAAPVAPAGVVASLRNEADEVVCIAPVQNLQEISVWYDDFSPTSDDEVVALLEKGRAPAAERERSVTIDTPGAVMTGEVAVPRGARALVLFAQGSGRIRKSPRNRLIAHRLQRAGLGTLLLNLLTVEEQAIDARDPRLRFDIDLLARRLIAATDWVQTQPALRGLRLGYCGASTGAAAALVGAAERPNVVGAVVSRGGHPELAERALGRVRAPTLLIVGGLDEQVLQLNRESMEFVAAPKRLEIVAHATHLFEEPGALERVAELATDWFTRHLVPARPHAHP